jgi:hypothetical protein
MGDWDAEMRRVWWIDGSNVHLMPRTGIARCWASNEELRVVLQPTSHSALELPLRYPFQHAQRDLFDTA